MILNCIVTDDEPIAIEIIEDYIQLIPGLKLQTTCTDTMDTFEALRKNDADVLFIDIQMPGISGLDFIRSLKNPPLVVFTTAYPNYALDGFELDAVDYLLKPISIERFLKTVDKLFARKSTENQMQIATTSIEKKSFFIKSNSGYARIEFNEILYVEGLENYIKIVCADKTVVSLNTMKYAESILPAEKFIRIHRSHIINLDKVETYKENSFKIMDKQLVVGKSYRKTITEFLKSNYSE